MSGIVVGVTSIIGTIITCKAAKAASSMARTIPSLTSGLQTIVTGTAETTRAILETTGTGAAEIIPMETLNILSEVSETISHSLSYYSIEDIPLESGVVDIETSNVGAEPIDTNIQSIGENIALGGEAVGEVVMDSLGSAIGGTIAQVGSIARVILGSIDISVLSKPGEGDFGDKVQQSNTVTTIDDIEKTQQKYVDDIVLNTTESYSNTESHNITNIEVLRLKHSLLDWNNSFCFFDSPNLACRLPSLRHSMEKIILIPLENLRQMFSENLPELCYSFWQELWCNWGKFFDLLSIERNIIQYNDSCPWDQFFLSVEESSNNLYQIASSLRGNGCYNETLMIRV